MKVTLKKATHVFALPCEIEVTEAEAHRLIMLGCAEVNQTVKEIRLEEKNVKKETKKAGK